MSALASYKQSVLIVSCALYLVSLCLPALHFAEQASLAGYSLLLWGWWGVVTLDPAWFANPLFIIALVHCYLKGYKRAAIYSGGALVLALSSFKAKQWFFNEGGGTPITGLGVGFYIWIVAIIVLLTFNLVLARQAHKKADHPR
ncbi:hypothetical protein HG263_00955 [Pseudoalteromonas sp. JBTF-M23]|uniref:Uncharacterized protein n=1 Tax=Pseudoalteromonas caenipelagi TaxID=2726988 RepID=A0A849V8M1_9GAMM|nr:hypothetical protein [Pseudoalteromonas caenipelagi]NOU49120.1 hypothetical protein [Pseudoalteromonas caenipelagi]